MYKKDKKNIKEIYVTMSVIFSKRNIVVMLYL